MKRLGNWRRGRRGKGDVRDALAEALPDAGDDATASAPADAGRGGRSPAHGLVPAAARADRFRFQDLVAEATADIGSRPGRLIMTTLGTVLGIGSLIATVGFAQTAAEQISRQFDAAAAMHMTVTPSEAARGDRTVATGRLPWDAPERVDRLAGVEDAVLLASVPLGTEKITAVAVNDPAAAEQASPLLVATSADLAPTLGARIVTGRYFDSGHDARGDRVAVLGADAAGRLGINRVDSQPSIFVAGVAYAVIGIIDEFDRRSDLLDAVMIPTGAARLDFGLAAAEELQVRIVVGAGPQVAEQSVLALAPDEPESLEAKAPAARSDLSQRVQGDVNIIFLVLGAVALLGGGLGIANVTLLSVMERTGEIGLRRALGATRRQIAAQFVVESVVIGLLGGLIGAAAGVLAILAVSAVQGWVPVIDPWLPLAGAVLGALVGWASGWYPARRAARVEPVTALRGS